MSLPLSALPRAAFKLLPLRFLTSLILIVTFAADRDFYRDPLLAEWREQVSLDCPIPLGTSTRQPILLRLRQHCGRENKDRKSQMARESAASVA